MYYLDSITLFTLSVLTERDGSASHKNQTFDHRNSNNYCDQHSLDKLGLFWKSKQKNPSK